MLITDTTSLQHFCDSVANAPYLAVDTEFYRERTYLATLCLIQIGVPEQIVAVDPLAEGIDLTPLWELFANPGIVKVFHSASQDLAILMQDTGTVPRPIFDTQIAAALCGYADQISYAALAAEICGASIDKSAQRTDWRQRPLKQHQMDYALSDVEYLRTIYTQLRTQLHAEGRNDWAEEEMERLGDPAGYRIDPFEQWRRVRVRRPTPRLNALLRELAAWRELASRERDLPRSWLAKDEVLIELAHLEPQHMEALSGVTGLGKRFQSYQYGQQILDAVRRALETPLADCPEVTLSGEDTRRNPLLKRLQKLLKERSETYGIASHLLANRGELERLVNEDHPDVRAISGWRLAVFGEAALALKTLETA